MPQKKSKTRVVILGAGFGGIRTALQLAKRKDATDLEITLVDKNDYHEFHADLYEVASAVFKDGEEIHNPQSVFQNLRSTAVIPLKEIFEGTSVQLMKGEVVDIDVKEREVLLKHRFSSSTSGVLPSPPAGGSSSIPDVLPEKLSYDILVIALGSCTNYYGIPHLEDFALPFKTTDDALNIRNNIAETFLYKRWDEQVRIVVVGGGLTGCELIGELHGFLRILEKRYGRLPEYTHLTLIEKNNEILQQAPQWMRETAKERFTSFGIDMRFQTEITGVTPHKLLTNKGKSMPYDVLIWTAGIMPMPPIRRLRTLAHEHNQCLTVTQGLRVANYKNIFALGDVSHCYDKGKSRALPLTAQTALTQADIVAENIVRCCTEQTLIPYKPITIQWIISLGRKYALTSLLGLRVWGIVGWFIKRRFSYTYFRSILPRKQAIKLWWRGTKIYIRND